MGLRADIEKLKQTYAQAMASYPFALVSNPKSYEHTIATFERCAEDTNATIQLTVIKLYELE